MTRTINLLGDKVHVMPNSENKSYQLLQTILAWFELIRHPSNSLSCSIQSLKVKVYDWFSLWGLSKRKYIWNGLHQYTQWTKKKMNPLHWCNCNKQTDVQYSRCCVCCIAEVCVVPYSCTVCVATKQRRTQRQLKEKERKMKCVLQWINPSQSA